MEHAVQQGRGDTQRATDTQAQGDNAHVLHRRVRKAALEVVLAKHRECRHQNGQRADNQQQKLRILGAHGLDGKAVEAHDHKHGALKQHAREQGRDRARSLGVGIGQPSVHGEQAGLGAKANHDKRKGEAHERRVELVGIRQHARQKCGLVGVGNHVGGVGVDQQRTEQAEGHAGGADHRILPRSLEGRLVLVDTHEEHGGKRGCLNGGPREDHVVGQAREQHGEHKQAKQRKILLGALGGHGALLDIGLYIGQREQPRKKTDKADEQHKDAAQRIEVEP